MRVLVADNMRPGPGAAHRGSFVRDQVKALRRAGLEIEHASFPPGNRGRAEAVRGLRVLIRRNRFDLVHAHFGLTGWCAKLAGASPLLVTFHGTDVRHPATGIFSRRLVHRIELGAAASRALFSPEGGRPALPLVEGRSAVLPVGADLDRFRPLARAEARARLGLEPQGRYLFFAAAPDRAVKRHDRAAELADRAGARLLSASEVEPERMPDLYNAAAAVLVTSENEGFGLPVVEALACEVPVLATPVGAAPALLDGLQGCLCAAFDSDAWEPLARRHLDAEDPRVDGRARAEAFGAERMAARVICAYRTLLDDAGGGPDSPPG